MHEFPPNNEVTSLPEQEPDTIFTLSIHPGMTGELLLSAGSRHGAIILTANALGTIPTHMLAATQELTDKGIPVFVLPDNAGTDHGVIRIADEGQVESLAHGAIYLDKGNINNADEVNRAVQAGLERGLRGSELAETIKRQFAFGPNDEIPVSPLGTEEGLRAYQDDVEQELGHITNDTELL